MDTFLKVLNFIGANWDALLGVTTTVITFMVTVVAAIKTKNWAKIKNAISDYIKDAELLNADGKVKKEIVLAKARTLCASLHIKFDEKKISNIIENIILITKSVNPRGKDKID